MVTVRSPRAQLNPSEEQNMIKQLIQDESGATAIEYGLIAGLVSVAIIVALTALGGSLDALFSQISGAVDSAAAG
jgi:pilus assembly protein Flp/PilA